MEPIKQEIINNIFENGDKLITGPILQTVLIDMIDDVNGKDQEILSKTGSWDNAVTQIPNLATKEEVTNLSESVARDIANVSVPEGVATEAWVQSQDYASKTYVNDAVSSSSVDLTGYATETWVQSQGYLTEHQDISGLATKTELNDTKNNLQGNITSLSESVARDIANVDLTGYATETWVQSQGYLTEHQDISNLATKTELTSVSESVQTDITNLSESVASSTVWKKGTGTDSIVQAIANGTNLPTATGIRAIATGIDTTASNYYSHAEGDSTNASGWGSHAEGYYTIASNDYSHAEEYRSKASGHYSHAEGYETEASGESSHAEGKRAEASGLSSHAEGYYTIASKEYSHAEGDNTKASGWGSHAEGDNTKASETGSHAEGYYTIASNQYEHAQGTYNHNSTNQIFSVGAGEMAPNYSINRRNALSVLVVPNSETQINTASVFVQNVGGYDGTNPTPGTNDLATVISEVSSIWKKGTGTDSIAQAIADGTNLPIATGSRAVAIGYRTIASGSWSHAEGEITKASGAASHAEGVRTETNGYGSHAEGDNTKASGNGSHAEGGYTNASGQSSHAEGFFTVASGEFSHAEGHDANASGDYSHAEGESTIASNQYEHAQGRYNHNSENQIFSVGAGTDNGNRRNAISILAVDNSGSCTASFFVQNVGGYDGTNPTPGTNDLATVINGMSSGGGSSSGGSSETLWKKGTGQNSLVQVWTGDYEAFTPTATSLGAVAIGVQTKASGVGSHAEGSGTLTSGMYSHAEGNDTTASGDYSHAEGYRTTTSGSYSHAEGYWTEAKGNYSHAEGYDTIASNQYEHAQGQYNYTSSNQIFSVGAGETINYETTRRNAISVLAVPNSETQVLTASFFVQNIGGYDGTNPIPGTNDLATVINNLPSGGGSSSGGSSSGGSSETLWKKGTGKDSIVQKIADGTDQPNATGERAIAEGQGTKAEGLASHTEGRHTKASGISSHAEGFWTEALGYDSHAEGGNTIASGNYSHAEGWYAFTTNNYEHAQGTYNHNSTNQIFSVGAGENANGTVTRRNAVSILAVPNSDTKILTSSFFVQNVGGYDGTNPIPGTNDLATVLNNTETWTFTLEDGSTVTKNIVMR